MKLGKESEKLEFKKSTAELKEGVISMAAILNKHGGGTLYFGIRNDGTPVGQMVSGKTLRDVSQAISNHLEPTVSPKISEVVIDDKQCISVEFAGDDTLYFAYGRAYIRIADEDKVMPPAELKKYVLRQNDIRNPWDGEASKKSPDSIKVALLKDYLKRAKKAGRIDFAYTSKEDALTRLDLIKDGKLKNAAAALFCSVPLLDIQMAIFATTEKLTFNDIKRDTGSVAQMAEIGEQYIRNNIRWRVVLDGSIQRKEIPEIPMDAVREVLINSFCHRDYKSFQNNEVAIYSNRVEIYNPGTFPEGLTPRDFIEGTQQSVKRNPLLAQLMYYVKDIESFGTGLKRISDACDAAGVRVEFQMQKLGFTVVFYRPDLSSFTDASISANIGANIGVNDTQKHILQLMKQNPRISAKVIAAEIGIALRNAEANIRVLKQAGHIKRVGADKNGYWSVITKR